jgi:hypothetical protein
MLLIARRKKNIVHFSPEDGTSREKPPHLFGAKYGSFPFSLYTFWADACPSV